MGNDPKAVKLLRSYYKSSDVFDADGLIKNIDKESDRSAVVILAAHLEDVLLHVIFTQCRNANTPESLEHLARHDGPLGSFSARIDMAHILGLYQTGMRAKLHLIRELRNACAHARKPISFDTPEVQAVVRRLLPSLPFIAGTIENPGTDGRVYRMLFQMVALIISAKLLGHLERYYRAIVESAPPLASLEIPPPPPIQPDRGNQTAQEPSSPPPPSRASAQTHRREKHRPRPDPTDGG